MPFPDIDPIAFAIGPFAVRWYALGYLFGVGLGAAYGYLLLANTRLWHKGEPPFAAKDIWDFAFWTMLAIVVGGRVGYVLFYNLPYYLANPAEIINTLDGGMSYHGGMLGLMLAVVLFTRRKGNGNWLSGLDLIASVATIGIFLVRIANFINAELYGAPTTLPWGVVFPTDPEQLPRHPSQLYEAALEGLLLFLVIRVFTHVFYSLRRPGLVAGIFGIGYGLSPHRGGIRAPARQPDRLSLWRLADHGHGAEPAAGAGRAGPGGLGPRREDRAPAWLPA